MSDELLNPQAFPGIGFEADGAPANMPGMTLRDWFAGQALSYLADVEADGDPETAAEYVYQVADALLAERMKPRSTKEGEGE